MKESLRRIGMRLNSFLFVEERKIGGGGGKPRGDVQIDKQIIHVNSDLAALALLSLSLQFQTHFPPPNKEVVFNLDMTNFSNFLVCLC